MTAPLPDPSPPATLPAPRAVVAIPVRDEAERIGACLDAIAAQHGIEAGSVGVVLFLNNCSDGTAQVLAARRPSPSLPIRVVERRFAQANAGWARREAMDLAARWLEESGRADGVILTTDADSRVPADWVVANLAAIAEGVDAVAGGIALDEEDAARLPAALHARGRLEAAYDALLTELEARIDPLAHDPWPRHRTTSGASLAVRLSAYRRVGGMPPLAVGEDRAFVSSLLSSDAFVRHHPDIRVVTSGRLDGRAPGGAADTIRRRCEVPESPCDPALERLARALLRFWWRARLRRLHAAGRIGRTGLWAPWLGIRSDEAEAMARLPAFGAMLAAVEMRSPLLVRRPLRPQQLGRHIRLARVVLRLVRGAGRLPRLAPPAAIESGVLGGPPVEEGAGHA